MTNGKNDGQTTYEMGRLVEEKAKAPPPPQPCPPSYRQTLQHCVPVLRCKVLAWVRRVRYLSASDVAYLSIQPAFTLDVDNNRAFSMLLDGSSSAARPTASSRRFALLVYRRLDCIQGDHQKSKPSPPLHVASEPSLAVFRQRFKTFLFSRSYQSTIIWLECYYYHSSLLSGHLWSLQ